MPWKVSPSFSLPHKPRGVQYTRPRAFKSLADEIDFNRKWLGGGKPVYQKGSRAVRYGKFAAKMFPHVRLGLTIWELYNIGKYVHSQYQASNQTVTESTPKLPYDLEPYVQTPEYQYQDLTGYEDDGPVPWYRTV